MLVGWLKAIGATVIGTVGSTEKAVQAKAAGADHVLLHKSEDVAQRVRETKEQLAKKEYRKIDEEHRRKLIEVKTQQMAVADLDRYYKALDRALMKFHATKMEDINKSITELWNKTYKGSDIDGLEIKSEHEGEDAGGRRN